MNVDPIETRYAGCRFRSRLEARWAVLFDYLGIRWEYEPQGFWIGQRNYLPDFYLPNVLPVYWEGPLTYEGVWVEVKGTAERLDKQLLLDFSTTVGRLLILGPIPGPAKPIPELGPVVADWTWPILPLDEEGLISSAALTEVSGEITLIDQQRAVADDWLTPTSSMPVDPDRCNGAYRAARSARFEHGERGGR